MLGVGSAGEAVVWLPGLVRPLLSQGLGHGCPSERAPDKWCCISGCRMAGVPGPASPEAGADADRWPLRV